MKRTLIICLMAFLTVSVGMIVSCSSEIKAPVNIVPVHLNGPTLKASDAWYGSVDESLITEVVFQLEPYSGTVSPTDTWDASAEGNGEIVGNHVGTKIILTLTADGIEKGYNGFLANEDCSNMFDNFEALFNIKNLNLLDTSKATTMSCMFFNCQALKNLDLRTFDTSNVTDMYCMFDCCYALKSLDLTCFDTSNVTDMSYMFECCYALNSFDLAGFDTTSVTDMRYMFSCCYVLESLDLSTFDTSEVERMKCMFDSCYALESLNLASFDTTSVKDMERMFNYCGALELLDLTSFDTTSVKNMECMFNSCKRLRTIYTNANFMVENVTDYHRMFDSCYNIVGGNGTVYDSNHTDKTYARIDVSGTPGYFTSKN